MAKKNSYNYICFEVLVREWSDSLKEESEKKIKQRLKYHKAGEYDQQKVDYIRSFCKELSAEVRLMGKSKYFKKTDSEYAVMKDFNVAQMEKDYKAKYDKITKTDLYSMIAFEIYYAYLH